MEALKNFRDGVPAGLRKYGIRGAATLRKWAIYCDFAQCRKEHRAMRRGRHAGRRRSAKYRAGGFPKVLRNMVMKALALW